MTEERKNSTRKAELVDLSHPPARLPRAASWAWPCTLCNEYGVALDGDDAPGAFIMLTIQDADGGPTRVANCCVDCARAVGKAIRAGWHSQHEETRALRAGLVGAVLDQLRAMRGELVKQAPGLLAKFELSEMLIQLDEIEELVGEYPNRQLQLAPANPQRRDSR